MRNFKKLKVWQKSHQFTLQIYGATRSFPKYERFGLTSQLRRSAISLTSNIAEGCGRNGEKEFTHFLSISLGSANEAEYQLILAYDLGYIDKDTFLNLCDTIRQVQRMLIAFIIKIAAPL